MSEKRDRKVYRSALCVIPPKEFWGPIQEIRKLHDPAFIRWMPHINILYPFVVDTAFDKAKKEVKEALGYVQPFEVTLDHFNSFCHGKRSATMYLEPDVEGTESFRTLYLQLVSSFPHCNDLGIRSGNGYQPHLTVGKWPGQAALDVAQSKEIAKWSPITWKVKSVFLISRRENDPFEIRAEVPLGASLVPSVSFSNQPALGAAALRTSVAMNAAAFQNARLRVEMENKDKKASAWADINTESYEAFPSSGSQSTELSAALVEKAKAEEKAEHARQKAKHDREKKERDSFVDRMLSGNGSSHAEGSAMGEPSSFSLPNADQPGGTPDRSLAAVRTTYASYTSSYPSILADRKPFEFGSRAVPRRDPFDAEAAHRASAFEEALAGGGLVGYGSGEGKKGGKRPPLPKGELGIATRAAHAWLRKTLKNDRATLPRLRRRLEAAIRPVCRVQRSLLKEGETLESVLAQLKKVRVIVVGSGEDDRVQYHMKTNQVEAMLERKRRADALASPEERVTAFSVCARWLGKPSNRPKTRYALCNSLRQLLTRPATVSPELVVRQMELQGWLQIDLRTDRIDYLMSV